MLCGMGAHEHGGVDTPCRAGGKSLAPSFPLQPLATLRRFGVSVNRLLLMVVSLQGDPARKLQLQHVSHKGKLATHLRCE